MDEGSTALVVWLYLCAALEWGVGNTDPFGVGVVGFVAIRVL